MSNHPTTRDRAGFVRNRDYYDTPDRFVVWKRRLHWGALLVAGAVAVCVVVWPSKAAPLVSPGPVSSLHATWGDRCDACHEPWRPIGTGTSVGTWAAGRPMFSPANRCGTCHAGAEHFPGQSARDNSCAGCHAEHRGPNAPLTRPGDAVCTGCHTDPARCASAEQRVSGFLADHPPFRSAAKVARSLKFSHPVHLAPGMALSGAGQPRSLAVKDIADPEARERYRRPGQPDTELVQLKCASCHRPDSADRLPPARAGHHLPVTYGGDCKGCHPLGGFDENARALSVPHGGGAGELRRFLGRMYAEEFLAGRPDLLDRRPVNGPRLDRPDPPDPHARAVLADRVAGAERTLLNSGRGCGLCHLVGGDPPEVRPVRPKQVRFEHAAFTHLPHRPVACRECHAAAYTAPGPTARLVELEPPLLSDIDGCRRCHAPAATVDGRPRGGARHGCTECHTYHKGGPPHPAPAANAPPPPDGRLDFSQFLRGHP